MAKAKKNMEKTRAHIIQASQYLRFGSCWLGTGCAGGGSGRSAIAVGEQCECVLVSFTRGHFKLTSKDSIRDLYGNGV